MTNQVMNDNPDNAPLARGGEGDSDTHTNYLTQADVDRIIAQTSAANDRRYNALKSRLDQTEQQLYESNQRYAELQEASQYETEEERREAIESFRQQQQQQQTSARGAWVERTLNAQTRSIKALADAGIPWGYKHIDWADDANSPEEVADRIITSIPRARALMDKEIDSFRRQNVRNESTQRTPTNTDETVVDTGEPSGSAPAGIIANFWNMSKEERERARKLARRRNPDGSSALSVDML